MRSSGDAMDDALLVGDIEKFLEKTWRKRYQAIHGVERVEPISTVVPKGLVQREVIRLRNLQREVIIKLFWENLDIPEISYRMKLSQKSVRKLVETALITIRRRLLGTEESYPRN